MGHLRSGVVALAAAVGMAAAAAEAGPVYRFSRVTGNGSVDVANQLTMEVERADGGRQVEFIFRNEGTVPASIVDVSLDDGSLLNIATMIRGSEGVNFARRMNPGALPGGTAIDFNSTAALTAGEDELRQANGINPGESLTVRFDLVYGQNPLDAEGALGLAMVHPGEDMDGGLRFGLVVEGINGGDAADTFVSTPVLVAAAGPGHSAPLPSAGAMGVVGLLAVASRRRRRVAA